MDIKRDDDKPPFQRKLLRRREKSHDTRFLTFSCFHRLPLLNDPACRDFVAAELMRARRELGLLLFAWVVMPDHVHVLMRAAGSPWSAVAESIKTQSAIFVIDRLQANNSELVPKALAKRAGRVRPRCWQHGGGFDRSVRNWTEFTKAIRYIHLNPVKRDLVKRAEDWRWSSIHWWLGDRGPASTCDEPTSEPKEWQSWKGFA